MDMILQGQSKINEDVEVAICLVWYKLLNLELKSSMVLMLVSFRLNYFFFVASYLKVALVDGLKLWASF